MPPLLGIEGVPNAGKDNVVGTVRAGAVLERPPDTDMLRLVALPSKDSVGSVGKRVVRGKDKPVGVLMASMEVAAAEIPSVTVASIGRPEAPTETAGSIPEFDSPADTDTSTPLPPVLRTCGTVRVGRRLGETRELTFAETVTPTRGRSDSAVPMNPESDAGVVAAIGRSDSTELTSDESAIPEAGGLVASSELGRTVAVTSTDGRAESIESTTDKGAVAAGKTLVTVREPTTLVGATSID